jgi:hypothetical protein
VAIVAIIDVETAADEQEAKAGEISEDKISIWQLPKVAWAGVALFGVNAVIGIGMLITPNMQTDIYGHEAVQVRTTRFSKPSPFTEVVDTRKPKVKVAQKLHPVAFEQSPLEETAAAITTESSLDLPRTSRVYQLDMPTRPGPAVYQMPGAVTYSPARVDRPISTGSDNRSVVIN